MFLRENFKSQRLIVACLIFIENSKTDQYRDGACSVITQTGTVLCPVENLKKLIEWRNLSGNDYVFCNITSTKLCFKPKKVYKKMSYTYLGELFIEALMEHVENLKK